MMHGPGASSSRSFTNSSLAHGNKGVTGSSSASYGMQQRFYSIAERNENSNLSCKFILFSLFIFMSWMIFSVPYSWSLCINF